MAAATLALAACTDLPTDAAAPQPGALVPAGVPTAARDELRGLDYVQGQVIVRYRQGADPDATVARHRGRRKQELMLERVELVEVAPGEELAVAAALAADADVEFAEPDYLTVISPCEVGQCQNADDVYNAYFKWDLHNTGTIWNNAGAWQATGKPDADIDWVEMFDALGGNAFAGTARIGIIDSGIRGTHVEFGNGRVIAARNFATGYPATYTQDNDGHGTHVAGIAAGRANGGNGTTGVAYGANIRLINAKACDKYVDNSKSPPDTVTSCPTSSQANAIVWAVDNGANVLNLSLGGDPRATSGSSAVRTALQYAVARNVLPVCASGNDNYPGISFPARFDECLAVGATNWSDERASYSNYGTRLDVVAPGGASNATGSPSSRITSAGHTSNTAYVFKSGTSMAAPQVAGLAAMLYATGMTSQLEIRERIKSTTDDLGPAGRDDEYGTGRINAYRAITGKDPYAPPVAVIGTTADAVEGSSITFNGDQSFDPNNHPITFAWTFGDGFAAQVANPTHTFADNGEFAVTLKVTDESNRATTVLRTVVVANALPVVGLTIAPTVVSGGTQAIAGSFTDAGALDAPWRWTVEWGDGARTSDQLSTIGAIVASHRFCAKGTRAVRLTVTDKDGGAGMSEPARIDVLPHAMRVGMPSRFNASANGSFPVRIHGSASLDVRDIDVRSVIVAAAAKPVLRNNGSFQAAFEDTDGDGFMDLVVHVPREALATAGLGTPGMHHVTVEATLVDECTLYAGQQVVQVN